MISYIASYILIFPVPEWRIRPATFSSTGDCDTWDQRQVQEYFFFFLKQKLILAMKPLNPHHTRGCKVQHILWSFFRCISLPMQSFCHLTSWWRKGLVWWWETPGNGERVCPWTCTWSVMGSAVPLQLFHLLLLLWYCLERPGHTHPSHSISSKWVLS